MGKSDSGAGQRAGPKTKSDLVSQADASTHFTAGWKRITPHLR